MINFSNRKRMRDEAEQWMQRGGLPLNVFNVVTAMCELGYVEKPPAPELSNPPRIQIHGIAVCAKREQVPKLPDGYQLEEPFDIPILAVDTNGKRFLICRNPSRLVPKLDGFENRYDFENAILI